MSLGQIGSCLTLELALHLFNCIYESPCTVPVMAQKSQPKFSELRHSKVDTSKLT